MTTRGGKRRRHRAPAIDMREAERIRKIYEQWKQLGREIRAVPVSRNTLLDIVRKEGAYK